MKPRKSRNKRINVVLKGVGRLRITLGTNDGKEFERRKRLVMDLYRDGRIDVLLALKSGRVPIVEVLAASREMGAHNMTAITLVRPLWDAITDTLPEMGKSAETRQRYELSLLTLKECGELRADARVRDLEKVNWKKVRPHFGGAADWNHLIRATSHFLSKFLGDVMHPFRRAVTTRMEREKEAERVVDITVETFWKLHGRLPLWAKDPVLCLALTTIRVGEYIWATEATKRRATRQLALREGKSGERIVGVSEKAWAIVEAAIPARYAAAPKPGQRNSATWRYQRLAKAIKKAADAEGVVCTLHDLRHLGSQLASDAGIADGGVADQAGHSQVSTTRRYTRRKNRQDVANAVADAILDARKQA